MALTVTNTNTLSLLNILNRTSAAQSNTLRQLTTGKRINTGKDDPAGLIALSSLNAELTAVNAALSNNQRTDSMLTVTDAAVTEISSLLSDIESLVVASTSEAGFSSAEIAANQAQIDDALAAIDRIVNATNFNGKKLLDGTFSIETSGVATNDDIENLRVFSRGNGTSDVALTVTRVASAQRATANFSTMASAATTVTNGETEVAIQGALGTASIALASSLTRAEVITAINAAKAQTGVSATGGASGVTLTSLAYGEDAFVSIEILSGGVINSSHGTATDDGDTTNDLKSLSKTKGVDAEIQVNGQNAGVDGLNVNYSANGLSLAFTLSEDYGNGTDATATTSFTVKASGGAIFQLGTTSDTRQTIGIDSLATYALGGGNGTARLSELKSGGAAQLKSDPAAALNTLREAISEVASVRGRIGGFQKFQVGSAINSLQAAQIGLSDAASNIGDTDFAVATAALTREQVLIQSAISLLGVANQQSAQILALLG
jgi:flagellin